MGPIPKTLRNYRNLIRVCLERNQFFGNISKDFGVYRNLQYMDLSYNRFYGEISHNWGKCTQLTTLKIAGNNISGRITLKIGDLVQLQLLDLSSCTFWFYIHAISLSCLQRKTVSCEEILSKWKLGRGETLPLLTGQVVVRSREENKLCC